MGKYNCLKTPASQDVAVKKEQESQKDKSSAQVALSVEQKVVERNACWLKSEKSELFRLAVKLSRPLHCVVCVKLIVEQTRKELENCK